jgi:hypothetical protein
VYRYTANSLEQAPTGGSAPSAADIADAVWDEALAGHAAAGSAGEALAAAGTAGDPWTTPLPGTYGAGTAGKIIGDNIDAAISSRLATAGYTAPLDAAGTRAAVGLAAANLDTQLDALPTAGENADAVWDEALAGHAGAGSAGLALSGASAPSAAAVADAVWDEAIAGHLGDGSTGNALNNATAAGNPWESVAEGAFTYGDLVRVIAGTQAGKTDIAAGGGGTATVTFRNITDSGDILVANMVGSERQGVTVTP